MSRTGEGLLKKVTKPAPPGSDAPLPPWPPQSTMIYDLSSNSWKSASSAPIPGGKTPGVKGGGSAMVWWGAGAVFAGAVGWLAWPLWKRKTP